jgi:hypothetical protein
MASILLYGLELASFDYPTPFQASRELCSPMLADVSALPANKLGGICTNQEY